MPCGEEPTESIWCNNYRKMAELGDYDFEKADAGASYTSNNEAGQVRVGG